MNLLWRKNEFGVLCSSGGRFHIYRNPDADPTSKADSNRRYLLSDRISGIDYECPNSLYARRLVSQWILPYEKGADPEEMENCMNDLKKAGKARHRGFTLTNMVIAMLVFAVLVTVGIFSYQKQVKKSQQMEAAERIQGYEVMAERFWQAEKDTFENGTVGITALNRYLDAEDAITPENGKFVPGDTNADGIVTNEDASAAQKLYDNRMYPERLDADAVARADVNGDGKLTLVDIDLIQKLASGERKNVLDADAECLRGYTAATDPWGLPYKVTLLSNENGLGVEFRSAGGDYTYGTEDDIVSLFQPKYSSGEVRF